MKQVQLNKRCLEVGIRGICDEYTSGHFVDDIHGISRLLVHGLKGADLSNAKDFFNEVQDEAYTNLLFDLKERFGKFKKFNSTVLESMPFKHSKGKKAILDGLAYGYRIELPLNGISFFYLDSIGLSVYKAGQIEFGIYNLSTKTIEYVATYDVTSSEEKIDLNIEVTSEFGSTYLVYVKTLSAILTEMNCGLFSEKCGCYEHIESFAKPVTFKDDCCYELESCGLTSVNFCLKASLKCDFNKLICDNADDIITAYKYKVGICLLLHRLTTDKRGTIIEGNRDEIKETILPMLNDHYERRIKDIVRTMKSKLDDDVCWSCDEETAFPSHSSYV